MSDKLFDIIADCRSVIDRLEDALKQSIKVCYTHRGYPTEYSERVAAIAKAVGVTIEEKENE